MRKIKEGGAVVHKAMVRGLIREGWLKIWLNEFHGIAMLVATIGIPAAMIKYVAEFKDDRTKFNLILRTKSPIIPSIQKQTS